MKPQSLVKYPGSKWKIMAKLFTLLPHHEHFVSAFGGSGAEILGKPRSALETYNDLDSRIYNLFAVIKDGRLDELKRRCKAVPNHSQRFFFDAIEVLKKPITDPVESAWAFLVVGHQGDGTKAPPLMTRSDFAYARSSRTVRSTWERLGDLLDATRRRFQRVQLFQEPVEKLFERFDDPSVCWLLDPPYYPATLNSHGRLYTHVMTPQQHVEFLDRILALKGYVVCFNYANEVYAGKLKHWREMKFPTTTNIGMRHVRSPRTHIAWVNYSPGGKKL